MLTTLRNAFKIKEIRGRILFTLFILVVVRLGAQLPIPGVSRDVFSAWFAAQTGGAFNFFDQMTGGSFTQMSVFALSITPYITSSIIMQLMTIAIPKLEEMQKDGEDGRKKIREYTRYVTIALAVVEGLAMGINLYRGGNLMHNNVLDVIMVVVALTAGSSLLMWMGEQITDKGVGNGISIILLINIISTIPNDFGLLYDKFMRGNNIVKAGIAAIIILAVILFIVVFVIYLQDGERRIPVQYSKKVVGRKMVGGSTSSIPLKVNTAGVMPIIFASSIMSLPGIIVGFLGKNPGGIPGTILAVLSSSNWCKPSQPVYSAGLLIYILLVVFFAYFYTSITFNPLEVADNMKKQGGFIPGIRPGKPTSEYLNKILNNVIFIGAVGLIVVAIIPILATGIFGVNVSFGGTSLIIIVGVVLETLKQIESLMLVRHYKGFLND
ncbi:preprotein translocase subunit SecY [Frisingicoccus caecimuris]|uniref:Protein translocase subunit SecY n=1 Tax=Frisingicoccus caecimuris TaxID=1796636 RepID=A0A4R2LC03_9FIRM|nr:preprotein translocase subunit SecY [Frisingicoccus caecimuris]MCR1918885.1 preprotein translocase subunit SecY [Frisingicoccus caecimuris]TCO84512.1 protein translocase subunit secY/sec61 alpha [Frisingicoccus caecimuris]